MDLHGLKGAGALPSQVRLTALQRCSRAAEANHGGLAWPVCEGESKEYEANLVYDHTKYTIYSILIIYLYIV